MEHLSKSLLATALEEIHDDLKDKDYPIKNKKLEEVAHDILDEKVKAARKMHERFTDMMEKATVTGFLGVLTKAHRKNMRTALTTFPGVSKGTAGTIVDEISPELIEDEE